MWWGFAVYAFRAVTIIVLSYVAAPAWGSRGVAVANLGGAAGALLVMCLILKLKEHPLASSPKSRTSFFLVGFLVEEAFPPGFCPFFSSFPDMIRAMKVGYRLGQFVALRCFSRGFVSSCIRRDPLSLRPVIHSEQSAFLTN